MQLWLAQSAARKNQVRELAIHVRVKCGRCQKVLGEQAHDMHGGGGTSGPARNPRLTIRCVYAGASLAPTEVTFGLSSRYGIRTAHEAHEWFLQMMRQYGEFKVETDRAGEPPLSFWSETVRQVVVE